jgi:hypothetical protein
VGTISGSFTVECNTGNAELYAYDLDEGTLLTGASVPSFACLILRVEGTTPSDPSGAPPAPSVVAP